MRKIFLTVLTVFVLAGAEAANAKNTAKIYLPIKSIIKSFEQAKRLQTLSRHSYGVHSIVFSLDGNLLATGSMGNTAMLWDVAISTIVGLFKKDEFETTNEYTQRVKEIRVPSESEYKP